MSGPILSALDALQAALGTVSQELADVKRRLGPSGIPWTERLLVSTKHAAELLDCGDDHVRDLVASGDLRAIRDGDRLRIRVDSLHAYVRRRGDQERLEHERIRRMVAPRAAGGQR